MRSKLGSADEELDGIRLAGLGVDELLVADLVAGLLQAAASPRADCCAPLGIAVDRIRVRLRENFRRHLVAHRFEEFELAAGRQSGGGELGAVEIAGDALVLTEEELLVHLLEIERVIEGKPHPRILEFRPADIEGEGLHHAEIADRKFLEQDALVGDRREIVGGRPVLGDVLVAPIDRVGLEGFERDGGVAEIFEVQLVEIVRGRY